MKILALLIRYMERGNIALIALTMMAIIMISIWITLFGGTGNAVAQEADSAGAHLSGGGAKKDPGSVAFGLGLLAAALSTGLSAVAAGIAVAMVGSAAIAAVAEKPETMGRSIIFVGLAEGIAIYGLIISIMILGKL